MIPKCQARVRGDAFRLPGKDRVFYRGLECGKAVKKKILVDDGDGSLGICAVCLTRWETELWEGWFDDVLPPNAPIAYSALFIQAASEAWLAAHEDKTTPLTYGQLMRWALEKTIPVAEAKQEEAKQEEVKQEAAKPKKQQQKQELEALTEQLKQLELEAKAPTKRTAKQQAAIVKQILETKAKLRLIR